MRHIAIYFLSLWVVLPSAGALSLAGEAEQAGPDIALDPAIECWYHSQFPTLGADVSPFEDIVRARLYFRCSVYPDYYFVDLTVEGGQFHGVAPQAEETCPAVHYYVEALSSDFTSSRTEERIADVTSEGECRRRYPAAAWFSGDEPGIVLGSTVAGPSLAPGFKSIGIVGFLSSSGAATAAAAPGGLSTGAIAGIAAAGAGAAGLGVLAGGGSSGTTTTSVVAGPPPTTSVAVTTTVAPTAPQGVKACFTLDPPSGVVKAKEPMSIDGRCSEGAGIEFRFDLGDGRIKEGQPFITAVWNNPGTYTLSLTVTGPDTSLAGESDTLTREITIERAFAPVFADFVGRGQRCIGEFDASPSTGDIAEYLWELDVDSKFGPVIRERGLIVVRHDWGNTDCVESDGNVRARLTVVGQDGSSDSVVKTVNILGPVAARDVPLGSSFTTELLQAEADGQVILPRGASQGVSSGTPALVSFEGRTGDNVVEAVITRSDGPVLWRFDFSQTRHFVPGSLRVVGGREIARDATSVTLRFTGAPGERARIELRLQE